MCLAFHPFFSVVYFSRDIDGDRERDLFILLPLTSLEELSVFDLQETPLSDSELFAFLFHVELHEEYLWAVEDVRHEWLSEGCDTLRGELSLESLKMVVN